MITHKELPGQHVPETERPSAGLMTSLGLLDGMIRQVAPGVKLLARLPDGSYMMDGSFFVFFAHRNKPVDPILKGVSGFRSPDHGKDDFMELMADRGGRVQITSPYGLSVLETLGEIFRAQLDHKSDRSVPEQMLLDKFNFSGEGRLQPGETVEERITQAVIALTSWEIKQHFPKRPQRFGLRDRFSNWINDPKLYQSGLGGLLFNPDLSAGAFERGLSRIGRLKDNLRRFIFPDYKASIKDREPGQEIILITILENEGRIRERTYPSLADMRASVVRESYLGRLEQRVTSVLLIGVFLSGIPLSAILRGDINEILSRSEHPLTAGVSIIGLALLVHANRRLRITSAIERAEFESYGNS